MLLEIVQLNVLDLGNKLAQVNFLLLKFGVDVIVLSELKVSNFYDLSTLNQM